MVGASGLIRLGVAGPVKVWQQRQGVYGQRGTLRFGRSWQFRLGMEGKVRLGTVSFGLAGQARLVSVFLVGSG